MSRPLGIHQGRTGSVPIATVPLTRDEEDIHGKLWANSQEVVSTRRVMG